MTASQEHVTVDQMKGAVGSLLFLWSNIERALMAGLRQLNSDKKQKSAHGPRRMLDQWSQFVSTDDPDQQLQVEQCKRLVARLTDALTVRNLVCHGLVGISAGQGSDEGAACLTVELRGTRRILTWNELQEMFAGMSQAPSIIANLTAAAIATKPK